MANAQTQQDSVKVCDSTCVLITHIPEERWSQKKPGCIDLVLADFGCWDSSFVVNINNPTYHYNDSLAYFARNSWEVYVEITPEQMKVLQDIHEAMYGIRSDICRDFNNRLGGLTYEDMTYCFTQNPNTHNYIWNVNQTNPWFVRDCPDSLAQTDIICIRKDAYYVFLDRMKNQGIPVNYINGEIIEPADINNYKGYKSGSKIGEKYLYKMIDSSKYTTTFDTLWNVSWVHIGYYYVEVDTCVNKCPEIRVSCDNAVWDYYLKLEPRYETTIKQDTVRCGTQGFVPITVVDSVQTTYSGSVSSAYITESEWNSIENNYTVEYDTLSPWIYNIKTKLPEWKNGKIPVYIGFYLIEYDDLYSITKRTGTGNYRKRSATEVPYNLDSTLWREQMEKLFKYSWDNVNGIVLDPQSYPIGIRRYAWIDQSVADSICVAKNVQPPQCYIRDIYSHVNWYENICTKDSIYYYNCYDQKGRPILDSMIIQVPDFENSMVITEKEMKRFMGHDTLQIWRKYYTDSTDFIVNEYFLCPEKAYDTIVVDCNLYWSIPSNTLIGGFYFYRWVDTTNCWYEQIDTTQQALPKMIHIESIYPQPFSSQAFLNVRYQLDKPEYVEVEIIDVLGRTVKTIYKQYMPEGRYIAFWDGRDDFGNKVSKGMYMIRISTETDTKIEKVIVTN